MEEFSKKYYRIKDVSELLNIPPSTLRYWEKEFPGCSPGRSSTNIRYYTPDDIRTLRMINYLVKVKGLRVEAAREELATNKKNVSKRIEIIDTLSAVRNELQEMLDALTKRR
ncbi:MAG: MerR family transcriptional regulator [Candidatus Amulumruptor caecigallinarius]|nr:MerR family transcriptional regulator [Candidatus Amulumruptor caecigallinarius]